MKQHYGVNATVIGHNIPGVVEYDPIISAQSFRTIDDIFRKMGLLKPSTCIHVVFAAARHDARDMRRHTQCCWLVGCVFVRVCMCAYLILSVSASPQCSSRPPCLTSDLHLRRRSGVHGQGLQGSGSCQPRLVWRADVDEARGCLHDQRASIRVLVCVSVCTTALFVVSRLRAC